MAVLGIQLTVLDLGAEPDAFELLCVRIVSSSSARIVAIVYRTVSESIAAAFFD